MLDKNITFLKNTTVSLVDLLSLKYKHYIDPFSFLFNYSSLRYHTIVYSSLHTKCLTLDEHLLRLTHLDLFLGKDYLNGFIIVANLIC